MAKKNRIGIGVDIGGSSVKVAVLRSTGKGIVVERVASKELPHDAIVEGMLMDSQAVCEKISEVLRENRLVKKPAALSVGGRGVMVKKITTDEMSDDELRSAIRYEAETNLPFDIKDVAMDYARLPQDLEAGGMEILLVAAKNDKVFEVVEPYHWAGGRSEILEAEPFALQAALSEAGYLEEEGVCAAIHIGFQSTGVSLFNHMQYEANRDFSIGGKNYVEGLIRELGISFDRAVSILEKSSLSGDEAAVVQRLVSGLSDQFAEQIERGMPEYFGGNAEKPVTQIILCGGGAALPGLADALRHKFTAPVEVANPFRSFEFGSKISDDQKDSLGPQYTSAVGLALRSIGENHTGFNLLFPSDRQKEAMARYAGAGTILPILGLSGLLLSMVVLYVAQENKLSALDARLKDVKAETDHYRDKIAVVEDLTKKRADIAARIDVIGDLDKNRFARIKFLELLNASLPALTWITDATETVTPRGAGLDVSGIASSNLQVSQMMSSLLQNPRVKGVDLTVSQQTIIAGTDVTQFTLRVTYPDLGLREALPEKPVDQLAKGAQALREKRAAQEKMRKEASK